MWNEDSSTLPNQDKDKGIEVRLIQVGKVMKADYYVTVVI
jgi:hypothetical protein